MDEVVRKKLGYDQIMIVAHLDSSLLNDITGHTFWSMGI